MRKAIFLLIALIAFPIAVSVQEEKKNQDLEEYTIFDGGKVSTSGLLHGEVDFTVALIKNSELQKGYFHVRSNGLKVEIRGDGRNVTTLKTLSSYKDYEIGVTVDSATLLVPNEDDKKIWDSYIEKLKQKYKLEGRVGEFFTFIHDGKPRACFLTNSKPDWANQNKAFADLYPNFSVGKIFVWLEKINVVANEKLAKNGPSFSVSWSRYKDAGWFNEFSALFNADELTLYVADDKEKKKWEEKLKNWKEQYEPHRVLPPEED